MASAGDLADKYDFFLVPELNDSEVKSNINSLVDKLEQVILNVKVLTRTVDELEKRSIRDGTLINNVAAETERSNYKVTSALTNNNVVITEIKDALVTVRQQLQRCDQHLPRREPTDHSPTTCTFCLEVIRGFRYTCIECDDPYDLCQRCEAKSNYASRCKRLDHLNKNWPHLFVRIGVALTPEAVDRLQEVKVMLQTTKRCATMTSDLCDVFDCDGCKRSIKTTRAYRCLMCESYIHCDTCELYNGAHAGHLMVRLDYDRMYSFWWGQIKDILEKFVMAAM